MILNELKKEAENYRKDIGYSSCKYLEKVFEQSFIDGYIRAEKKHIQLKKEYDQTEKEAVKLKHEVYKLKQIILLCLKTNDLCYLCEHKGQKVSKCEYLDYSKCLENMLKLWEN